MFRCLAHGGHYHVGFGCHFQCFLEHLFENPYKYNDVKREKTHIYTPGHRAEARATAAKTFVLLKNDGKILPIAKKGKIALVGPMANTAANMPGTWSVAADFSKYKTLRQGFEDAVKGRAEILRGFSNSPSLYFASSMRRTARSMVSIFTAVPKFCMPKGRTSRKTLLSKPQYRLSDVTCATAAARPKCSRKH